MSFKLTWVELLTRERLQLVTAAQFAKFSERPRKEEDEYRSVSRKDSL